MNKHFVVILMLAVSISYQSFAQETLYHDDAGVSITIPAYWSYEAGENDITVYSPDEEVAVALFVVSSEDLEGALDELYDIILQEYPGFTSGDPESMEFNGMSTIFVDGNANDGTGTSVSAAVISAPNSEMILFAVASEAGIANNSSELEQLIFSISPY